ncbi:MAG: protein kinase [Sandaracinus sp.]
MARLHAGLLMGGAALAALVAVVASAGLLVTLLGRGTDGLMFTIAASLCLLGGGVFLPGVVALVLVYFMVQRFRDAGAMEALVASSPGGVLDARLLVGHLGERRAEETKAVATERAILLAEGSAPTRLPTSTPTPVPAPFSAPPSSGAATPVLVPPAAAAYAPRVSVALGVPPKPLPAAPTPLPSTRTPGGSVRPPSASPYPAAPYPSASPASTPARVAVEDLTGRTLKGTWEIERRLASGGMGTVYVTRHARTGRRYALKTLLPDEQLSPNAIGRFEREARAATAIGHLGIAAVHDFDTTPEGAHYLVMDLLVGESLETRLARVGRLPWPEARRVILEVADALAAAHRAGVLHRDVKPSNVFMAVREGAPERAMLLDFGLAKPIEPNRQHFVTRTGAIVGTAHYMAPEQARGLAVDVRTDVYGLGALLYEMIAGVPPFLGSTPFAVMQMLLTEDAPPPSTLTAALPAGVDAVVLRALAKEPADRFQDVDALKSAIDAVA